MKILLSSSQTDVSGLFTPNTSLREILNKLGLLEEEVICIDRKNNKLLLLSNRIGEDDFWEIREVLSKG